MSKREQRLQLDDLDGIDELEDFDPVGNLTGEQAIAAYITDVLATGNLALLNSAIADVVRARRVWNLRE
jgi:DNA-binding phage protein